ncbi:MAG TPA: TRAP transporter TatT component family protein [Elusimicrobiota bacterium]|nr:TRAP transporter TatT component family protein [Elusimicrobiota bacterium]
MRKDVLLAAAAAVVSGCSAVHHAETHVAVLSTADILTLGRGATLDEPDYQLARDAMPAQLKLIETLIVSEPEDRNLRRLAAEGFAGGAFLFIEESDPARAKGLYLRGRDHALAALALKPRFAGLAEMPLDQFLTTLKTATADDVPDLFWAATGWAGYINLSKDDAAALAELPKAVALMSRVIELDPTYHFDAADVFFGVYYASRPRLLGGDPEKAKAAFARAHKATKGRYLMTHVLNARWYAVAVQDRELFKQLLTKVLESPSGQLPEARLTDEAAKLRAARLLEKIDDYF